MMVCKWLPHICQSLGSGPALELLCSYGMSFMLNTDFNSCQAEKYIDWDRAGFAKGICLSKVRLGVTSVQICGMRGGCKKLVQGKKSLTLWVLPQGKEWDLLPSQVGMVWCTCFSWGPALALLNRANAKILVTVSINFPWICLFCVLTVCGQQHPQQKRFP